MGPASWSTHLPSTKILIWLVLSGGRGEKLPWQWGEVCFGDGDGPQLGEAGWGKERERERDWERKKLCTQWLLNHINGTLFNWLRCQKNWHQHIWGRYAWSKWEYDCEPCLRALSMFYQDCAIGVASKGLSVFRFSRVDSYTTYWKEVVSWGKILNETYAVRGTSHRWGTTRGKSCPDPVFNLTAFFFVF